MKHKQLIFMDHDGGIDDLLSLTLLLTMEDKEIIGVNITPADCFAGPAIESTFKILELFGRTDIPVGRGDFHGVNAFPDAWRARPEVINVLPMLINLPPTPDLYSLPNAVDLLINQVSQANAPVSFIMTGPCSTLVQALAQAPHLREKIAQVVWMGGAFRTQGNVKTYYHDSSAEWNVFWDPIAAKKLFELELPLVCIPLDVTNHVPVNKEFLSTLARQASYSLSNLAGQLWALTIDTIPSYHYIYFMWDILATSYLDIPEAFTIEKVKARVSDRPPNAGQTLLDEKGFTITIATDVNKEAFYSYLLKQLKRNI